MDMTEEEMADGMARARLIRLVSELAEVRHATFHAVYSGLMSTKAWKEAGDPDPKHISAAQIEQIAPVIERNIERARAGEAHPRHIVSKAPPAPWSAGGSEPGGRRKGE